MPTAWPLTARAADLERLGRDFADGALGGVVLTGPAGVGKTRLGEEALRAASGGPTARAVGHAATRAIPLGALTHLLPADLVRNIGVEEDDRALLFHRARLSLAEQAGEQRLLLAVDDVDQLDDTSLALLLPLTVDRVVFLVATVRTGRHLPDVVDSLVKDGHVVVRELPPLDGDEVATLLHRVLDGPVDARSVERLATVSEGNLQVLQEVVRRAEEGGALHPREGVWHLDVLPIPARLEELVESRLAEVDADGRHVLEMLALAGTTGAADLDWSSDEGMIEALEDHGFVKVTVDGKRMRVALAHSLYGEVLRHQMSPLRERRMKRQLADGLEVHGARRREDLTQLALWRLDAGGEVDAEVLLRAGRLALVGRDAALAQRFATAAAERGASHDAARIAVEAAHAAADLGGAEQAMAGVWSDPELPDEHRAHLCRRLAMIRFIRGDLAGALAAVEEAVDLIDEPAPRASVRALRALLLAYIGRPLDALAVLDPVEDRGDPRLRRELASAQSRVEICLGRFEAAIAAARAGARAQQELPEWLAQSGTAAHLVLEAHAYAFSGRYREARAVLHPALARAEAAGAAVDVMWFQFVLGQVERDGGYGRAALPLFAAAVDLARRIGQRAPLVLSLVGVAQAHLLLGNTAAAAAALAEADDAGDRGSAVSYAAHERARERAEAWLLAGRGDLLGARRLLAEVADQVRRDGIWSVEVGIRHDLVRLGVAAATVDRLAELAGTVEGPYVRSAADHARVAADGDVQGYGPVVDQFEAMDAVVAAAEAAAEMAELHRRQGDRRAAAAAEQRVARLVERSGARTPGLLRGSGVEPLTAREREVALLAAAGTSSKEIAARLSLSTRTVDTHLARAYRKLGIAGREELATALEAPSTPTAS